MRCIGEVSNSLIGGKTDSEKKCLTLQVINGIILLYIKGPDISDRDHSSCSNIQLLTLFHYKGHYSIFVKFYIEFVLFLFYAVYGAFVALVGSKSTLTVFDILRFPFLH